MHKFGSNKETLAEIAVAARNWAKLNPNAYKKDNLTIDDVINSQPICSPLNN